MKQDHENGRLCALFALLGGVCLVALFISGNFMWLALGYAACIPASYFEPDYPSGLT